MDRTNVSKKVKNCNFSEIIRISTMDISVKRIKLLRIIFKLIYENETLISSLNIFDIYMHSTFICTINNVIDLM